MDTPAKVNCDYCGKKECEECVKDGGKTFCCERCCTEYKTQKDKPKQESVNVCKFC